MSHEYIHLSDEQRDLLGEFIKRGKRPAFPVYRGYRDQMRGIARTLGPRPKIHNIPWIVGRMCGNGFYCQPVRGFDAEKHLPAGWGLFPLMHDSSLFWVDDAGSRLLKHAWNIWINPGPIPESVADYILGEQPA